MADPHDTEKKAAPNIWQAPPHRWPKVSAEAFEVKGVVRHEWCFFWKTDLSNRRMEEICAWLRTLTPEQTKMLNDIVRDVRQEERWEASSLEE